jgi:TRAP-type C4-dicarboxylate transport system substrate-binding protein
VEVWRSAGFNPVPLPSTEIATALQTGLVEALGSPPQVAVISQFFNHARYMTDLRWQLLLGATIITKASWEKIPADVRPELLKVSQEAGARLQKEIREAEAKDLEAMKKRGLTVVPVSAAQRAQWQKLTESIYPRIKGKIVPAEAFDEAMRYRDEYRKQRGAAAGK